MAQLLVCLQMNLLLCLADPSRGAFLALRRIRFLSLGGAVGCGALGVLRALSNICNEAFYENSKQLTAVNYFH